MNKQKINSEAFDRLNTANLPCKRCINKGLKNIAPMKGDERVCGLLQRFLEDGLNKGHRKRRKLRKTKNKRRSGHETETLAACVWS